MVCTYFTCPRVLNLFNCSDMTKVFFGFTLRGKTLLHSMIITPRKRKLEEDNTLIEHKNKSISV